MRSEQKRLTPINDTLNPKPNRFGMPWYLILALVTGFLASWMLPWLFAKVLGALLCAAVLGFGWWLTKDDPEGLTLLFHSWSLPAEFDPGKRDA